MKHLVIMISLWAVLAAFGEEPFLMVRMIRHGQPGVAGTIFTEADKASWSVLGLTPLGRKQAELTGSFLKKEGIQWSRIIASPQERTAETAEIIAASLDMTYSFDADLREVGNAIKETLPALRNRFPHIDPNEKLELSPERRKGFKEDNAQCGDRGKRFIENLLAQGEKGPILLVTHGHFMFCTIQTMTGQEVKPWNCGMAELKVWPDGRAELVRGAYPEILSAELVTSNQELLLKDPWDVRFIPHPAQRPDAVSLVNNEYQDFANGRGTSWKLQRATTTARQVEKGEGVLSLTGGKKTAVVMSPRFPLEKGKKYICRLEFHGEGTGACRVIGVAGALKEFPLAPETNSCEMTFSTDETEKLVFIRFEARPESKLVITNFLLSSEDLKAKPSKEETHND